MHRGRRASSARLRSIEWTDLEVVLAICRTGSLSGAARLLAINHSTVFRKINAIEERLGVRLFERLPTGYEMTDAGQAAMHYAERIEDEVCAFERDLLGRDTRLHGKIRIGLGEALAVLVMPPLLSEFQRLHPEVSIDLIVGLDSADLSRREVDIAVRVTRNPPPSSVGRHIGDFEFCVYCAEDYLKGCGSRELKDHDWVLPHLLINWLVPLVWKTQEEAYARCRFTSNAVMPCLEAARYGMGLAVIAAAFAEADERLVRVLGPVSDFTMQLWILMHPDLRRTARITALTRFLAEKLRAQKCRFLAGESSSRPLSHLGWQTAVPPAGSAGK